jgi:sulfide:quinone oxidoreductase
VAAVEAVLALRELCPGRPSIELVAPNREFTYLPSAVGEPFGLGSVKRFDLAAIVDDLAAALHPGSLVAVDGIRREVVLASGSRVPYDAAIVAVGARRTEWLAGAVSFDPAGGADAFAELLGRVEAGRIGRIAFACPHGVGWTLPLYELALLTAAHVADRDILDVEITVVTAEAQPLEAFGDGAGRMLRDELADRGIRLRAGATVSSFAEDRVELTDGEQIAVDAVVALPRPHGPRVSGLPADGDGFIVIDEHCRVPGLADVYAAGDGTTFPVKQGGIATQQADVAAQCLAAALGAPLEPCVFEPTLEGVLLTGVAPMYLRADARATPQHVAEVSADALWSPATKIAGHFLGPYLSSGVGAL